MTGGFSVMLKGCVVSSGVTVCDSALKIIGGMTLFDSGAVITANGFS